MHWKGIKVKSMRIISQNGKYDLPYESFVFVSEQNIIYAVNIAGSGTRPWLMAEYTRPEKTQKAMEMLHGKYNGIEFMKITGTPELFAEMKKLLSEADFDEVTGFTFRFPANDGIEVKA